MGKELVVTQPTEKVDGSIWPNIQDNLSQPDEATILACIGAACVQDTIFFNDLDRRSNYRNRIVGVQVACLYAELERAPSLLEKILDHRKITLAGNTDPIQAKLNGLVQAISYGGRPAELQAYEYSRRGKVARGILLLAADNKLTCSLATADEIYRRFGSLTQTAVFERVDQERQKPKGTQRLAATKPAPSVSSAKSTPSIPSAEAAAAASSAKGTIDIQIQPGKSAKGALAADDQQIVSGRTLGLFDLDFLTAEVADYAVFAVEKKDEGYQVTLLATGGEATADLCDYALSFLQDGDDRA